MFSVTGRVITPIAKHLSDIFDVVYIAVVETQPLAVSCRCDIAQLHALSQTLHCMCFSSITSL